MPGPLVDDLPTTVFTAGCNSSQAEYVVVAAFAQAHAQMSAQALQEQAIETRANAALDAVRLEAQAQAQAQAAAEAKALDAVRLDWLRRASSPSYPSSASSASSTEAGDGEQETEELETTEQEIVADAEDEALFLQQLASYSLDLWDHYTHVRVAFVMIKNHGTFLLRSCCVPAAFLLHSYCILAAFLLHSCCIPTAFLLHSYCFPTTFF